MTRLPATSRKFLLLLRATQTARVFFGAWAVPFPRSVPPGIWAHNLLARRAKADGTLDGGEAEDKEDVKAAKEKDDVEEATTQAKPSFDQVSRNKAVDEAASAQTADPVEDAQVVASARDEQLQKTAQEKEDKGFDESTEKVANARKFLELALARWEGANENLKNTIAMQAFAIEQFGQAVRNGDEKERKEAREELEKAKEEFEKAESKVQTATEEATKAREELEKAESTAPLQASVSSSLTWIVDAEATAFANELRMAQPLTTSNCAHENTADVLSATAAGIEIFPLNTSLNPKEANPWLFVRRQQREVWQAAFNASRDVVVTGSPGIGKSFSMSFLLRALMQANNTFVFEARRWNRAYLFKPHADGTYEVGSVDLEDWRPGACDELKDPANYYVIDPAAAGRGDICSVKAKTVVAPSPDPQHLGEWKKNINLQYLYMAACSLQEARCIVKCLRPELNENQVDERYRRFGGILRHLICHPEPVEKARNDTLSNQNLVRRIWTSGVIDMGNDLKPAHLLFQIVPKDDCTESRVEFVSEEAVDLTIKQFEDELLQFLTSFDKLQIAGLGVLYERFAHQVLCRGTLLLTRLANVTVPMFEMRLAPLDVEVVDGSGSDLFKAAIAGQPRYMRPRDEGLPVIDSCLAPVQAGVMTCFQITVSAKHTLDIDFLESSAQGLGITKIVIYWVVPRDSFRDFYRGKIFGKSLEFEQRVLSLDAPHNPFTLPEMEKRLEKADVSELTEDEKQRLGQETDDLKRRYLVMKSFEESDVKTMINQVLKLGKKKGQNQDPVALCAARAWDDISARMTV